MKLSAPQELAGSNAFRYASPSILEGQRSHNEIGRSHYLQYTINFAVDIASAIIQSQAYNSGSRSPPKPSVLTSLQEFLTQLLGVYLLFILFVRESPVAALEKGHYFWFLIALLFPVIAFALCNMTPGVSGILSYLGTFATGALQVILALNPWRQTRRWWKDSKTECKGAGMRA